MRPDLSVFLEKDNMEHLVGLVFLTLLGLLEACQSRLRHGIILSSSDHCLPAENIQYDLAMSGKLI